MAEIALEAGFGKGTLYWYWKSKEELCFALVEEYHNKFVGLVRRATKVEGAALEKLAWLGKESVDLSPRGQPPIWDRMANGEALASSKEDGEA